MTDYKKVYINGIRHYKVGKNKYPSITSILNVNKDFSEWNKNPVNRTKGEMSRKLGTWFHFYILQHFVNKNEKLSQETPEFLYEVMLNEEKYKKYQKNFKPLLIDFLSVWEKKLVMLSIEEQVYNTFYGFAGTLDMKFLLKEGDRIYRCIGDIKTGNPRNWKDSISMQLTAYNSSLCYWAEKLFVLWMRPYPTKKEENQLNNWYFREVEQDYKLEGFLELFRQFKEKNK